MPRRCISAAARAPRSARASAVGAVAPARCRLDVLVSRAGAARGRRAMAGRAIAAGATSSLAPPASGSVEAFGADGERARRRALRQAATPKRRPPPAAATASAAAQPIARARGQRRARSVSTAHHVRRRARRRRRAASRGDRPRSALARLARRVDAPSTLSRRAPPAHRHCASGRDGLRRRASSSVRGAARRGARAAAAARRRRRRAAEADAAARFASGGRLRPRRRYDASAHNHAMAALVVELDDAPGARRGGRGGITSRRYSDRRWRRAAATVKATRVAAHGRRPPNSTPSPASP